MRSPVPSVYLCRQGLDECYITIFNPAKVVAAFWQDLGLVDPLSALLGSLRIPEVSEDKQRDSVFLIKSCAGQAQTSVSACRTTLPATSSVR